MLLLVVRRSQICKDDISTSYTFPDPNPTSVLSLQQQHGSTAIWEGNDPGVLTIRHNYQIFKWPLDERVRLYLINSGLYSVSCLGSVRIDHALVTVLSSGGDRRPTSSTFQSVKKPSRCRILLFSWDYMLTDDQSQGHQPRIGTPFVRSY